MIHRYHTSMLKNTLGHFFTPEALREVTAANLGQDGLGTLLGHDYIHFDACKFKESLAYIDDQHGLIANNQNPHQMRAAFGRLTHGAQDFYAHSNYVDLWLRKHGGLERTHPEQIDGLDPELLSSPELKSGYFYWWRDLIYYIPGISGFARKYLVFADSHEQMHLDDPSRGPRFAYAIEAAQQRTLMEYQRAVRALTPERLAEFQGYSLTAQSTEHVLAI